MDDELAKALREITELRGRIESLEKARESSMAHWKFLVLALIGVSAPLTELVIHLLKGK
jgi:hypothetical protein